MTSAEARHPFSDSALARRLEAAEGRSPANFVDARALVAPLSGAEWIEGAGFMEGLAQVARRRKDTAGVALLAGASTIPEARNKGAQLALLDSSPGVRRRARVRFGHDGGVARKRIATQRRASWLPHRVYPYQVAARGTRRPPSIAHALAHVGAAPRAARPTGAC